jgi:hypothetical protein
MRFTVVRKDEWQPDHSPMKMNAVGIVTLASDDVWFEMPIVTREMLNQMKVGATFELELKPLDNIS